MDDTHCIAKSDCSTSINIEGTKCQEQTKITCPKDAELKGNQCVCKSPFYLSTSGTCVKKCAESDVINEA